MMTPLNLINHELTGLQTHVIQSTDLGLVCKKGRVIGETREMLHLSVGPKTVSIPKGNCTFDFQLPDNTIVRVDGKLLRGRPEERLKKRLTRRW